MAKPVASMTGAGSGAADHPIGRFTVEARSVNNRFLKTSIRVHGPVPALDRQAEETIRRHVARGHVTLGVRFLPAPNAPGGGIDDQAFLEGATRLKKLADEHDLRAPVLSDVLRLPGVVSDGAVDDPEALRPTIQQALNDALTSLVAARRAEGARLVLDLVSILDRLEQGVAEVAARAQALPTVYSERLKQRLQKVLEGTGVELDPQTLAREVAVLADRSDVTEEITRLGAHVAHVREVVEKGGAVGRRLDFLIQELNRETNTIGSKSSDLEVTRAVVEMKADVERLREQVQNLE